MSAQFQSLFENVCRCFGHTPNSNTNTSVATADGDGKKNPPNPQQPVNDQVSSTTAAGARRRTNRLELKDKQWDELFEKNQRGQQQQQSQKAAAASSSFSQTPRGQPPRPEGYHHASSSTMDHETAKALAQVKLAANPPRYRTKRKRSAQVREEIFRSKEERNIARIAASSGRHVSHRNTNNRSSTTSTPQTDFSRLLDPSLALCFATPIRGTEEEPEETDMRSVDNSDTATLNTNGEDTVTSTLYFDSKYAHIQETRPPMPLFNQFKIGQAKDEIRTIMATDSHSSLRMIKMMQQQQMTRDPVMSTPSPGPEEDDSSSSGGEEDDGGGQHHNHRRGTSSSRISGKSTTGSDKQSVANGSAKSTVMGEQADEEMQDAMPDVKAVSSSTDSSRLSNTAVAKPQQKHQHTV